MQTPALLARTDIQIPKRECIDKLLENRRPLRFYSADHRYKLEHADHNVDLVKTHASLLPVPVPQHQNEAP
jgi:hypothetical protein